MPTYVEAYLDIETTGRSPWDSEITVVGIHICNGDDSQSIQLVSKDITADSILETLEGVNTIYTYKGSRFDLPFIHTRLGINLEETFAYHDLMYDSGEITCMVDSKRWNTSLAYQGS